MPHRPDGATPDEVETAAALRAHRPELLPEYLIALPDARAAVLGRLWGAIAREPLAGIGARRTSGVELAVRLVDGRTLHGSAPGAAPFGPAVASLDLDGVTYRHPARLMAALALPGDTDGLVRELDNSVANLALARASPAPAAPPHSAEEVEPPHAAEEVEPPHAAEEVEPSATSQVDPLIAAEQSVIDGHPLHPCCRTRVGLSTLDVLAYAPEHRPVVHLAVVAVPPNRWTHSGAAMPPLLPVHPAQLARVLATGLVRLTDQRVRVHPLMSLRTVAPAQDRTRHVKTALNVQMTSAVRTLSPAAIHNGPVLSQLLVQLANRTPGLTILRELAAGAALVDGAPSPSLAVLWREAPVVGPDERVLPLAALTSRPRGGGRPAIATAIDADYRGRPALFLGDLADRVLPPVLGMLRLGVALEAHGQNTLIVLRGGRPVRLLYRDFGGVRVSPRRLAAVGIEAPRLLGGLACDDPTALRTKVFAAVLSTVLAEVVSVLVRWYGESPDTLWGLVAASARRTYAELPADAGGDAAALFGAELPIKAMTAMRLASDPLAELWATLPNPLAGLG